MKPPRRPADEHHDWRELRVETFNSRTGGNAFYKAASHPLGAERIASLVRRLSGTGPVAVYDPVGRVDELSALHDLRPIDICGIFAQKVEDVGKTRLGHRLQPVTELHTSPARSVFVAAFDADRLVRHARPLLPAGAIVVTLDEARLPDDLLSDRTRYLAAINFATNFAFFRDGDGAHTRLVSSNYWARYGAASPSLWCRLFGEDGNPLATWRETLPADEGTIVIDSRDVRDRFRLGPFTGQLFVHAVGIAGHDLVKYTIDVWSDAPGHLSCTHDANAWPSNRYAGLPAPADDQTVRLWIQNSHPRPIPAGAIGLARMGSETFAPLDQEIPPYATVAIDTRHLVPEAVWPAQLEVRAGRHAARPRYEVTTEERSWLSHVNVEREDLSPDPAIRRSAALLGKGFVLPAPILPRERWRTVALPTPMAVSQRELPIAVLVYGPDGTELVRRPLGGVPRGDCPLIDVEALLAKAPLTEVPVGHLELVYDFADGGEADGWLHASFRYLDHTSGHAAETSFGSHIFNMALTFGDEPQSYSGPPPGLSTRLFVRLGHAPYDTMLHLIYPASRPWRPHSQTRLTLVARSGRVVSETTLEIPCSGSRFLRYSELFDEPARRQAGDDAHLVVRDETCRLFGYHGLVSRDEFSLDHMFGA